MPTCEYCEGPLCLVGPLKKRGLRASDVGQRALRDVQPTLLLFLRKLARVEAGFAEGHVPSLDEVASASFRLRGR